MKKRLKNANPIINTNKKKNNGTSVNTHTITVNTGFQLLTDAGKRLIIHVAKRGSANIMNNINATIANIIFFIFLIFTKIQKELLRKS